MKTKNKARITRVWIEHKADESTDYSLLGEYSRTPGKNAVDRQARGDMGRNECRYCNITMSAEETGNPESVEQDYQRLEALQRGDWHFIGVIAKAEIVSGGGICQTIRSGGLWGVESDSGKEYLAEVAKEELDTLRAELAGLGFSGRQIDYAFGKVETK